jgi:hypothetical protein
MQHSTLLTVALCACLATPVFAQTKPAANPPMHTTPTRPATSPAATTQTTSAPTIGTALSSDLSHVLHDLADPSTHDQALAQAKKLPASAIVPLGDLLANPTTSVQLKTDINTALDDIYSRARAERQAEDAKLASAWSANTGLGFYVKSGPHPQWDDKVEEGFLKLKNRNPEALTAFQSALNAGCRDPFVRLANVLTLADFGKISIAEMLDQLEVVRNDMNASSYPTSRKLATNMIFLRYAMAPNSPSNITNDHKLEVVRIAIHQYAGLATDHAPRTLAQQYMSDLYDYATELLDRRKDSAFGELFPAVSKAFPQSSLSSLFESSHYIDWAWMARGGGWASDVTDEGWKLFHERLDKAQSIAETAWRLDPLAPNLSTARIAICMGRSEDRDTMELWFSRAMAADPHCFSACGAKALYLQPKWLGSEKEALEFGRWCVAHGDGNDRIPTVLLTIYADLGKYGAIGGQTDAGVWADVKSVYEKLLADKTRLQSDRANYLRDRADYLKAAVDSKQWNEVSALMRSFGDDIDLEAFGGKALYDYSRKKAETEAAKH